ncbi:MAG: tyrosine-type recombinase/integrase [Gemmataceae bacterium]
MGTVFKKQFTRPLPADATITTRKGETIARWRDGHGKVRIAPVTRGKDGSDRIRLETEVFYGRFRNGNDLIEERSTECRDRQAAEHTLRGWEREVELIAAGVMTAEEQQTGKHRTAAIEEHIEGFLQHLDAIDATATHRSDSKRYLNRLAQECGIKTLAGVSRERLERWLAARATEGMSARTRNAHRNCLVAFCNWCIDTTRLTTNPVERVPRANEKADPRRRRRSLTVDELVRLLDAARRRPVEERLIVTRGKRTGQVGVKMRPATRLKLERRGHERCLTYKTLVMTGLRMGELVSLTVCQLHLDGDRPFVELEAADEKNREGNTIALRRDLAEDLRGWLDNRLQERQAQAKVKGTKLPIRLLPDEPLFTVPDGLLRIFDRDLEFAGIPKRDDRDRTIDIHSLRTTFGSLLSRAGVSPRTAQQAMRHSSIDLTMNVYTDPRLLDVAGAVESLPALPLDSASMVQKPTGTDTAEQV